MVSHFLCTRTSRIHRFGVKICRNAIPLKQCTHHSHGNRTIEQKSKSSDKWGYRKVDDGFMKHDKNTPGIYHLGIVNLPKQLENSINKYLQNFPKKHLIEDAIQLSKHLQNRGRPTERTWTKYKEAKAYRKEVQEHVDEQKKEASSEKTNEAVQETSQSTSANKKINHHLTKKPKIQEYKTIRYQRRECAAFIADRAPATYGATLRVLHEIARRCKDFKPETILDFGSGAGTATWAAHKIWKDSIKIYQCVDVSRDMNDMAEQLLRNNDGYRTPHYIPRVYYKEFLPFTHKVTYDVVVASYSLTDIPFTRARQDILDNLWRKTNHFLVIVDKGNNEGFDVTMQARDLVTNNRKAMFGTEDEQPSFVFSPCPHDLACPRLDANTRDHPCNFEQRVQLSYAQKSTNLKKYGYFNELFSYVVLCKGERNKQDLNWARLLRPVRLREKHIICDYCSKNGTLEQKILTKRKDSDIYKCVRHHAKWGDLLPIDVKR
ncbi:methyltransferase-like protein 17, mitochondrial [Xenia sp. Carnegie-2017]|uniref:methyltransferase-like protein 17, mitochondrial n=1 Tax=Xenia sp. Carnegie-2017 TaxID=2897299 RepID=UPI001F042584|nr:methyltransferase-like protein 17, mitochondrial [Xenia sp. Carnegie-2017]